MLDVLDVLLQLPPRAAGCEPSEVKRSEAMGWGSQRTGRREVYCVWKSEPFFSSKHFESEGCNGVGVGLDQLVQLGSFADD
jgi:hypothetical protein